MLRIIVENDILDAIARLEEHLGRLELGYKMLLIQDGTLEYLLSIIDKDTKFNVIRQVEYDEHIEREAILKGRYTVNARSIIYKDALPTEVLNAIRDKKLGIGKILREYRLETFRDILEIGYDKMLYRVYEIIYKNRVAFRIREDMRESSDDM